MWIRKICSGHSTELHIYICSYRVRTHWRSSSSGPESLHIVNYVTFNHVKSQTKRQRKAKKEENWERNFGPRVSQANLYKLCADINYPDVRSELSLISRKPVLHIIVIDTFRKGGLYFVLIEKRWRRVQHIIYNYALQLFEGNQKRVYQ